MKAAWQHKEHFAYANYRRWEQVNLLRLNTFAKNVNALASVTIFATYSIVRLAVKYAFELTRLIFATEVTVRETRDEMWIYRQIK